MEKMLKFIYIFLIFVVLILQIIGDQVLPVVKNIDFEKKNQTGSGHNEDYTENVTQTSSFNDSVQKIPLATDMNNLDLLSGDVIKNNIVLGVTNNKSEPFSNTTADDLGFENVTKISENSSNIVKVNCSLDKTYGAVEIVNVTRLMELLILDPGPHNKTRNAKEEKLLPATCMIVLFYAKWCIFSSQAAPHFNAIPRLYPHIKAVAIDAMKYQNFNTQYGIVGVPTLMLVHNGKPVAKFNETIYTIENFCKFASHLTNLQSNGSCFVTTEDFSGPVSNIPTNETDYCLILSWVFIVSCILYCSMQSQWWRQFIELIQNTWRESNAQHEHED